VRRIPAASCVLLVLGLCCLQGAAAKGSLDDELARGLEYLAAQGGEGPYPAELAPYAVEAALAAGLDPAAWPEASRSALASVTLPGPDAPFLKLVRPAYALALAGHLDDWQGEDVEARLRAGFDGQQFGEAALLNDDLYATLALVADGADAGDAEVHAVVQLLTRHQNADGGWGYAVNATSSVDTTAMALLLLQRIDVGVEPDAAAATDGAVAFVLSAQDADSHGFAEAPGGRPNCDSTAWAMRVALGGAGVRGWTYLLGLQNDDGGFSYQPGQPSNTLCSVEAVTVLADALAGRTDLRIEQTPGKDGPAGPAAAVAICLLAAAVISRRFRRN
jgi:Prenyltransferase and squalene oxidase repeat